MFLHTLPYAVSYFFAEGLPPLPQSYRHALGLLGKPTPAQPQFSQETQDMRTVLKEMKHQKRGAVEKTTQDTLKDSLADDHTEALQALLKRAQEPFPMLSQFATPEETRACAQQQRDFLKSMAEVRAQLEATIQAIRADVSEFSLSGRGDLTQTLATAEEYLRVESRVKTNNRERVHLGVARTVAKTEALASKETADRLLTAVDDIPRSYAAQMAEITRSKSSSPEAQTEVERLEAQVARNTARLAVITRTAQEHAELSQRCAALRASQAALAGHLKGLGLDSQTYGRQRLADAQATLDSMKGSSTINRDYAHCLKKAAELDAKLAKAQAKASKDAVTGKLAEIKAGQQQQQSKPGETTPEALREKLAQQQLRLEELRALQQEANRLKQKNPELHTGKRAVDSAAAALALEVKATGLLLNRMDRTSPSPSVKAPAKPVLDTRSTTTQPASEPPTLTAQAPMTGSLVRQLASVPTASTTKTERAPTGATAPAALQQSTSSAFAPVRPSSASALSTPATHTESNRGSRMETTMRRTPSLTAAGTAPTHTTTSAAHAQHQLEAARETVV